MVPIGAERRPQRERRPGREIHRDKPSPGLQQLMETYCVYWEFHDGVRHVWNP